MESLETAGTAPRALRDGKLAGSWTLDPAKSEIKFQSRGMWGLASVRGVFKQVSGEGTVTQEGAVSGALTVAAGSLDTRNRQRDTHLRSAAFFDVANYPDIAFTADRVESADEAITVSGTLKVRDQARPVSFQAQAHVAGPDELCVEGQLEVNRAEFGLSWNKLGMASMDNTITVRATFTRR